MTFHHKHKAATTRLTRQEWQSQFPARHRRFRRAAVPIAFGTPTEEERAAYAKERAEWGQFLDSAPTDSDTPTEPQQ